MGHLISRGIRIQQARVRESMYRGDPEGCIDWRVGILKCHKYSVPGPDTCITSMETTNL